MGFELFFVNDALLTVDTLVAIFSNFILKNKMASLALGVGFNRPVESLFYGNCDMLACSFLYYLPRIFRVVFYPSSFDRFCGEVKVYRVELSPLCWLIFSIDLFEKPLGITFYNFL